MAALDWIIAGIYFVGTLAFGIFLNKKTSSSDEYFSGGKEFAWWAIAGSVIATQVSAVTFIGAPGWAYTAGLAPIVLTLNIPIVMWFIGGTLVPFFYNSGVVSIYEYVEGRFGTLSRTLLAATFLFKLLTIMGVVILAPSIVLSHITGLDITITILIMTFAIFVTTLGGLTAVIWIDVLQIVILWVGIITSFYIAITKLPVSLPDAYDIVQKAGKLKAIDFTMDFTTPNTLWAGIIGGLILHISYFGGNQAQVQRMLAAKSMRNLKLSLFSTGFVIVAQMLLFLALGLLLYVFYNGKQFDKPNDVYVTFLDNVPSGFLGLIVAAIFAAGIGSMVASLNSMATVYVKDIYEKAINKSASEETKMRVAKISTFVFGGILALVAILMSQNNNLSLLEAISKYGSYTVGSTISVFILGIFTQRANEKSVNIGLVLGIVVVLLIATFTDIFWMWYSLVGFIVTTSVGYAAGFIIGEKPVGIEKFTIKGQKQYFIDNKLSEIEEGYYVIPGKFENKSYLLIAYFLVVCGFLYYIGK